MFVFRGSRTINEINPFFHAQIPQPNATRFIQSQIDINRDLQSRFKQHMRTFKVAT